MKVIEDILRRLDALEKRFGFKPMNFKQACAYLGYSPKYLYKLCYTHKIPFHNPSGRTLFFFERELDKWILKGRSRKVRPRSEVRCQMSEGKKKEEI